MLQGCDSAVYRGLSLVRCLAENQPRHTSMGCANSKAEVPEVPEPTTNTPGRAAATDAAAKPGNGLVQRHSVITAASNRGAALGADLMRQRCEG